MCKKAQQTFHYRRHRSDRYIGKVLNITIGEMESELKGDITFLDVYYKKKNNSCWQG